MGFAHAPGDAPSIVEDELLRIICLLAAAAILLAAGGNAFADGSGDPTAGKNEDGKNLDKEGNPTDSLMARSIGTPIPAIAVTTRTATFATGLTGWVRATLLL